jgi:hypothetical protein
MMVGRGVQINAIPLAAGVLSLEEAEITDNICPPDALLIAHHKNHRHANN